ncbi:MAG: 2OG-Fe(II) oxygenase [Legionellales bacterium]|nr:2OG-Fe(II) oxygenase [Legionellales bacterium]
MDNSHDAARKSYRTVNLLYYVSPNWGLESGGNFELWDRSVEQSIVVPCLFNRLLVMETNLRSWHAVNPLVCDGARRCVFNCFFSEESPVHTPYFNMTKFRARPEQKLRRALGAFYDLFRKKR